METHTTKVEPVAGHNGTIKMFYVTCEACGRVSVQNYREDARAVADRHQEVGGFERRS